MESEHKYKGMGGGHTHTHTHNALTITIKYLTMLNRHFDCIWKTHYITLEDYCAELENQCTSTTRLSHSL